MQPGRSAASVGSAAIEVVPVLLAAIVLFVAQALGLLLGGLVAALASGTGTSSAADRSPYDGVPFLMIGLILAVVLASMWLARASDDRPRGVGRRIGPRATLVAAGLLAMVAVAGGLLAGGGIDVMIALVPAGCAAVGVVLARR